MAELRIATPEEVKQQWLDDIRLAAADQGVDIDVSDGSDVALRAIANSQMMSVAYEQLRLADQNSNPMTSDSERIGKWMTSFGLTELPAVAAYGRVRITTTGLVTIPKGSLCSIGGITYRATEAAVSVATGHEIAVEATVTGTQGNAAAGTVIRWRNPVSGLNEKAIVSYIEPIANGREAQTTEEKKQLIADSVGFKPGDWNWAQFKALAESASPGALKAYIYPCLGGPASMKVAISKVPTYEIGDISTLVPGSLIAKIKSILWVPYLKGIAVYVESIAETPLVLALNVSLPPSASTGGDGTGWINGNPYPRLVVADGGRVTVRTVASTVQITLSAQTTETPVGGLTKIAWFSPSDQKFYTRTVLSYDLDGGYQRVVLDKPLMSDAGVAVAVGDMICPASTNMQKYAETMRKSVSDMGPGENTADPVILQNGRALRYPLATQMESPSFNTSQLRSLMNSAAEISTCTVSYINPSDGTPPIPATVDLPPNKFKLTAFGIYP